MRPSLLISLALLAACSESGVKKVNSDPTVYITSHEDGDTVVAGEAETLRGQVGDPNHAVTDLAVSWLHDGAEVCTDSAPDESGVVSCAIAFETGGGQVALEVRDPDGAGATDRITLDVQPPEAPNSPPACAITAPESGTVGAEGELVTFTATASDPDSSPDALAVDWTSDKDGALGSSTPTSDGAVTFPTADLTVNTHVITLTVTDDAGETCATDTVFTVGTAPSLTIVAPTDGATLPHDEAVVFEATVADSEDLPTEVALSWASDIDGVFSTAGADSSGAATATADALSAGAHTVTVTATDTDGLYVNRTVAFVLNQAPEVTAVTIEPDPATNSDTLTCSAVATDPDGGTPALAYAWSGGATGPTLPLTSVVAASGDTIACTATATDDAGATAVGTASITLTNRNPEVALAIAPTAPTRLDTVTCTATVTEPDDDATTVAWTWTVDGAPVEAASPTDTTSTLASAFDVGDTVACTATADDGKTGVGTATATVTIENAAPVLTDAALLPATLYTNDTATASAAVTDPDGDSPTVTYAFSVDGTVVQDGPSPALDGAVFFDKGQSIAVVVTATDGTDSASASAGPITVQNSLPSAPEVSIDATERCPDGWSLMADGVRCVDVIDTEVTSWYAANAECEALSGTLASITSAEDNAQVLAMASDLIHDAIWIGFSDEGSDGDWYWVGGEASGYTNWRTGGGHPPEPNGGTIENCAEMYHPAGTEPTFAGFWNDSTCGATAHNGGYACQVDADDPELICQVDTPSADADGDSVTYTVAWDVDGLPFEAAETTDLPGDTVPAAALGSIETWTCTVTPNDGTGDGASASATHDRMDLGCTDATFDGRVYSFCTAPLEWADAEDACVAKGGHLATVRGDAQYAWLKATSEGVWAKDDGGIWWIGYNDIAVEGEFVWSSGSASAYTDWAPDEPNNSYGGGPENCTTMKHHDKPDGWNDLPCTGWEISSQGFICEAVPPEPCPGGSADISSYEDLAPYLDCTELDGLSFHMTSGITEVELPRLETVAGSVYFHQNADIARVSLPELSAVDGYVYFHQNADLRDIALPNLETVGEYLYFHGNEALETLELTDSLTTVGSYIHLVNSPLLCAPDLDWSSISSSVDISGLGGCD